MNTASTLSIKELQISTPTDTTSSSPARSMRRAGSCGSCRILHTGVGGGDDVDVDAMFGARIGSHAKGP